MGGQYGVALLSIGFFIVVIVVVAAFVFFVYTATQLKKMAVRLDDFCRTTDERLKPVLEETEKTMKSIRVISDNIGAVTGDIREVTGAAADVADNIRAVSMIVTDVREQVSLRTHGIMAGIQAALGVLMKHQK
ncbi:MAG TPA: DUF948 domain-containing protein [Dissulfurispiraceae bacterium]|nr:DUF948 domain-containing protein [Dissulfurispiraceae bacterium]